METSSDDHCMCYHVICKFFVLLQPIMIGKVPVVTYYVTLIGNTVSDSVVFRLTLGKSCCRARFSDFTQVRNIIMPPTFGNQCNRVDWVVNNIHLM